MRSIVRTEKAKAVQAPIEASLAALSVASAEIEEVSPDRYVCKLFSIFHFGLSLVTLHRC